VSAQFEIKHRHTNAVLYAGGGETLRDVVVAAVKSGAYLRGADLGGADLGGADLRGAYLGGADLGGADLRGADLRGAYLRVAYLGGADLRGADLRGAYLGGADLGGADLRGADLRGADLGGAKLIGDRPFLQIGPIGSRSDFLLSFVTDKGVMVKAGCFNGTLDEFSAAVDKTHGDSVYGIEYMTAIAMIDAHAALWTPTEASK